MSETSSQIERNAVRLSFAAEQAASLAKSAACSLADDFAGLAAWTLEHRLLARYFCQYSGPQVHGYASHCRLGGVFVQPARTVLGIRAWPDALEGIFDAQPPVPYALFEIEKIVRMMLHQSGLAFEILASAVRIEMPQSKKTQTKKTQFKKNTDAGQDFPAHRLIEAAITRQILDYYWDIARHALARVESAASNGLFQPDSYKISDLRGALIDLLDAARHTLTGWRLSQGVVDFYLPNLIETCANTSLKSRLKIYADLLDSTEAGEGSSDLAEIDHAPLNLTEIVHLLTPQELLGFREEVEAVISSASIHQALPDNPADYDWLNELVVDLRLGEERR